MTPRRLIATAAFAGLCLAVPVTAEPIAESGWGAFGVQTRYVDPAVKPGDDFFRFVNGKWIDATEIPADRASIGTFVALRDLAESRMRAIMDELAARPQAPGSAAARVAAAYKAYLDTAAIESAGMAPARPLLARIKAAATPADLMMLFAEPSLASPIGIFVGPDIRDGTVNVLYASQRELGLPDRDLYLVDGVRNLELRARYRTYLATVLGAAGYADAAAAADAVITLETKLAAASWSRAENRAPGTNYSRIGIDEFAAFAPEVPLKAGLARMGLGAATSVVVRQLPPAQATKLGGGVPALARLIASEPVSSWQAWLAARFIARKAAVLPRTIDEARFAFYGTALQGQAQERPRWKRAIGFVEESLGELTGQLYVERYLPRPNEAAVDQIAASLRRAMAANLAEPGWMGPDTRREALAKLSALTDQIGYPARFKTYEGLVPGESAFANSLAADAWRQRDNLRRLGQPVDRTEWGILPQTPNGYYSSQSNQVVITAAMLEPPLFSPAADPAVNYGAIGAVIGRQMADAFDGLGSNYDAAGKQRRWWSGADQAAFEKLTSPLAAQYDAFCPLDETAKAGQACVNGRLTLDENIGDLAGLALAYRAYRSSLNGGPAPVIEGYTGDQRFFMAWAQVYRSKIRENALRQQLRSDPHAPSEYRVNGVVRNFAAWYDAFGVKPGDKLYLPPEQRVRIWR